MSNVFVNLFAHLWAGVRKTWKVIFGQAVNMIMDFLRQFAVSSLGTLAVSAVSWVEVNLPGDASSADKKTAATEKLKEGLLAAGYDLKDFGESMLNFLIESALQAIRGGLAAVQHANGDASTPVPEPTPEPAPVPEPDNPPVAPEETPEETEATS